MERIEITAKTVLEAEAMALEHFKTVRENIVVRIVEPGSKGLFGIGVKNAKIVASIKDENYVPPVVKAVKQTATKPVLTQETSKVSSQDNIDVKKTSTQFIEQLIALMNVKCSVSSEDEENNVKIVITGDDVGTIIGRRGETLDAVQYITNLCINKGKHGDDYKRVIIDTENYRAKREETLVRLANSMASKAIKYRKTMSFEPMNPYERRIIHSALQNHKYVTTYSVGEEPNRKIVIKLK